MNPQSKKDRRTIADTSSSIDELFGLFVKEWTDFYMRYAQRLIIECCIIVRDYECCESCELRALVNDARSGDAYRYKPSKGGVGIQVLVSFDNGVTDIKREF